MSMSLSDFLIMRRLESSGRRNIAGPSRSVNDFQSLAGRHVTKPCHSLSQDHREWARLLPLLPDDVTLTHVVTRLPWRTIFALSSVSYNWHRAIRKRKVYEARVLSDATNPHVIVSYDRADNMYALALYSLRDKSCLELPSIPNVITGIPEFSQGAELDGKFYVLGGNLAVPGSPDEYLSSNRVYVLDLAGGLGQWERCASMIWPRQSFGCGVMDGKIFVFGGTLRKQGLYHNFISHAEAYDPKLDRWSSILRMKCGKVDNRVEKVGAEFIMYESVPRWQLRHAAVADWKTETYTPMTGQWRTMKTIPSHPLGTIILAKEAFCEVNSEFMRFHDPDTKRLRLVHHLSLERVSPGALHRKPGMGAIEVLDDELISIVFWTKRDRCLGAGLLQTVGLHGEDVEIAWQRAPGFTKSAKWDYDYYPKYFICPLRL